MGSGRIRRPPVSAEEARPPLPIIGKIKTGLKAQNEKFPRSVDYFIPTGDYAKAFTDVYGDKPSRIQVMFLSDNPKESCDERFEYRDNSGRLCAEGDGVEFKVWNEKKKEYEIRNIVENPDLMEDIHKFFNAKKGWEVTLKLRFIIPAVNRIVGLWELTTKGSKSSIPNVVDTFDAVNNMHGSVCKAMFDMNVKKVTSQKPGEKSTYPVISLVVNNSEENLMLVRNFILQNNQVTQNLLEDGRRNTN
jgi:hypothetical protein